MSTRNASAAAERRAAMQREFAQRLDLTKASEQFKTRFWGKVDRRSAGECWEWTAHRKVTGYGQFVFAKGEFMTSSRVALALTLGRPLALGEVACHRCDNPPCCNPTHLFAGSQSDNTVDCVGKGRKNPATGERQGSSKLTEGQVLAILAEPERFRLKADLADQYNVSAHTIKRIRNGEKWAYLGVRANPEQACVNGHLLAGSNLLVEQDRTRNTLCATCAEDFRKSRLKQPQVRSVA